MIRTARHWSYGLLALAVVASCLGYAAYTQHIWEDFFITYRHSENLVKGHGLVFDPGVRIHGFTSPLGVLLPALCALLTGSNSYLRAIWLFRVMSALALAGGVVFILARMEREEARRSWAWWMLALALVFEVKTVSFSMNGMETGFLILFLGGTLYWTVHDDPRRWIPLGLCWAGLMWSRPDGCIPIAALGLADLCFGAGPRTRRLVVLLRAAALCTVLYLPWFLWAWWYYGTPVPHTVLAKQNLAGEGRMGVWWRQYWWTAAKVFLPIYYVVGDGFGWPTWLRNFDRVLCLFPLLYWVLPTRDAWGRSASLGFALVTLYLAPMPVFFPWYGPPALVLGLVAIMRGVPTLCVALSRWIPPLPWAGRLALAAVASVLVLVYGLTSYEMKVQTAVVERGNRQRIGEWLRAHVKPGETVYLECVGYIGYFSGAHMADWPGLVSPEVIRLAREHHVNFFTMVPILQPDWIVLRRWEMLEMQRRLPSFDATYEQVQRFDAWPALAAWLWPHPIPWLTGQGRIPGEGYVAYDTEFVVLHRKT